jgi:hypothetical protein
VLPTLPGRPSAPLASDPHAVATLEQHEQPCYTGELGLYHTGTGATSAAAGNSGPTCDSTVSDLPSETSIFTLNSSIAGVSEGNYGRLGAGQQGVYTNGNARAQLDPSVWEMPGAMPEIVPGGSFGANIDLPLNARSMVMQAWGAYGILWPVVHQWLGVSPDVGRGRVAVVPQVPVGQTTAAGTKIMLGSASIDVTATHHGTTYTTRVTRHRGTGGLLQGRLALDIGAVLPVGSHLIRASLNGHRVHPAVVTTARGMEASFWTPPGTGTSELVIEVAGR